MMVKEIARWLPRKPLLIKQLVVSAKSFLTLPFYKPQVNGVQFLFKNIYYVKPDALVFDGTTFGYYSKIKRVLDLSCLNGRTIIDLGCGKNALFHWLKEEGVSQFSYIGIDFAIDSTGISNEPCVVNDDIIYVNRYLNDSKNIIVMCNVLCYTNDENFNTVLHGLGANDAVLLIEPSPNLFWDAHFSGIKPIYRRIGETTQLLEKEGFEILSSVQDYYFNIADNYIFPLSYCLYAIKH
jgi:hypothetical protein